MEEEHYHHLEKGTKRALICGAGLFNAHLAKTKSNPKLKLSGDNFRLFAHADVCAGSRTKGMLGKCEDVGRVLFSCVDSKVQKVALE